MTDTLDKRITTGLETSGYRVVPWAWSARLPGLVAEDQRVVMVRFTGFDASGAGRREKAEVAYVLGSAQSETLRSGDGVQERAVELLRALRTIPSCFPDLLPFEAIYDFTNDGTGPDLVALVVECLGGYV